MRSENAVVAEEARQRCCPAARRRGSAAAPRRRCRPAPSTPESASDGRSTLTLVASQSKPAASMARTASSLIAPSDGQQPRGARPNTRWWHSTALLQVPGRALGAARIMRSGADRACRFAFARCREIEQQRQDGMAVWRHRQLAAAGVGQRAEARQYARQQFADELEQRRAGRRRRSRAPSCPARRRADRRGARIRPARRGGTRPTGRTATGPTHSRCCSGVLHGRGQFHQLARTADGGATRFSRSARMQARSSRRRGAAIGGQRRRTQRRQQRIGQRRAVHEAGAAPQRPGPRSAR